ncbi:copper ABC transporter permease [Natrinema saccharevitans]|uniref:Copper ABC transporter permease n=1 Tax=Natrinema saccharevitans TaxID=301967 RepID=A0A1S8AVF2_9EURY|nr:ABC transporter permease subunit [Natrinema saccharevitans]OLZ40577.1 copper ABC transporter permease [Natrinema saccharevitans]
MTGTPRSVRDDDATTATDDETALEDSRSAVRAPKPTRRIERIVGRELRTVSRNRTFVLLGAAFAAVMLGIAWVGGGVGAGYVPTIVDLLTPLELLVPIVAVAFGYRAILGDRRRGELDVLETYPIAPREHVLGVFVGRAVGLLGTVVVSLLLVGGAVVVGREEPFSRYASHAGADSPLLFARFVVLTALFALSILAVAIAISALVSGTRSALALSVVALVVVLVGLDLALVYGLASGYLGESSLVYALAVSPLSAYRGLVFETVVITAAGTGPQTASPAASLIGLAVWTIGSLAVATSAIDR